MKNTKIVSGFPGVGKSTLLKEKGIVVLDSDSSHFSWVSEGVRHPDFPANYMRHIRDNLGKVDYILVSSHDVVRRALQDSGLNYSLVYPAAELKDEYLARYKARGNDEKFTNFIGSKWDGFIRDIEGETFPTLVKLGSGEFLAQALSRV